VRAEATFNAPSNDNNPVPFRKRPPHRRTGRRPGAPDGNRNRWVHGKRSRDHVECRRTLMQLLRKVREATAAARSA
jgi:hypothetical protein